MRFSTMAPLRRCLTPGVAAQALLLAALISGWQRAIADHTLGLCCTVCAAIFLVHEQGSAETDATSTQIKGADVLCECVMFGSDCLAEGSARRRALDLVAVALNGVNAANFLRARWRGGEWWLLCEAANSATDLCACWLEASGLESERTEDACLLILACIAALLLADEIHSSARARVDRSRVDDKKRS